MPSITVPANTIPGMAYAGNWSAYADAHDGKVWQQHAGSGTPDYTWLPITFPLTIPMGWEIVGIQANFNAGQAVAGVAIIYNPTPPPCQFDLVFALGEGSIASGNIVPSANFTQLTADVNPLTVGGPTSTFGLALSPATLNAPNFALFVRLSTQPGVDTTDALFGGEWSITVFYNPSSSGTFMPNHLQTVHQKTWYGIETTAGTDPGVYNLLVACQLGFDPKITVKEEDQMGSKFPSNAVVEEDMSDVNLAGYATYNEMGAVLQTLINAPTSALIPGSMSAYRHSYSIDPFGQDAINTLTLTRGDVNRTAQTNYAVLSEFKLNMSRKAMQMSGKGFGREYQDNAVIPVGANCVQTLTFGAGVTGGTFVLTYDDVPTAPITFSATPATLITNIETALNALGAIGVSGVVVGGTGPYTVTFSGTQVAGKQQKLLGVTNLNLTGGTNTLVPTMTTPGGFPQVSPISILGSDISVYMSSSLATLSSSKLTNAFSVDFDITGKQKESFTLNDANLSWNSVAEDKAKFTLKILAEADSTAMQTLTWLRTQQKVYFQLVATSKVLIDGTNPFRWVMNIACKVNSAGPLKDADGGIWGYEFGLSSMNDATQGYAFDMVIDNDNPNF